MAIEICMSSACLSNWSVYQPAVIVHILLLMLLPRSTANIPFINENELASLSASRCVVAIANNAQEQTTQYGGETAQLLLYADVAFKKEPTVFICMSDFQNDVPAIIFPRFVEDRACLQKPNTLYPHTPKPKKYIGPVSPESFVEFINEHCQTFRKPNGELSIAGLHRENILDNLFSVQEIPDSLTMADIFKDHVRTQEDVCRKSDISGEIQCHKQAPTVVGSRKLFENVPQCERIPVPDKDEFIHNYLYRSKPVVITGAIDHWPAISKWTQDFFRREFGDQEVHVKLTPKGEYEGVEPANLWEMYSDFKIPADVYKQLSFPDLVMVRPAELNTNFSDFLNLVQNISDGVLTNFSAYLEYAPINQYFQGLMNDISEMSFFHDVLNLEVTNVWLSDGNTLGKTHFDPFDNFLCQLSGKKEVIMFEPHNDYLYEAHIPQAILSYNASLKQFRRSKLLENTAMVMSPVDILSPNFERFPKFGSARPISCSISEGDVLFMPAFWWHEVQSRPNPTQHRNLAVNFWYRPFLKKEFPCPECRLDINPQYRHLL